MAINRYIGGGKLYITPYNETTGSYGTEREIGEVKEAKININADKVEVTNHDGAFEEVVDELVRKKDLTLSFKTQNISLENLQMAFYGTSGSASVATAAVIIGAASAAVVGDFTGITDGEFTITIDGVGQTVTGLDFSADTDLTDVAATITAGLTGATCTYDTDHFVIASTTTGAASTISYASAVTGGTGTDISSSGYLEMSEADTPTLTQGGDPYKTIEVDTLSSSRAKLRFVPESARGKIKQIHFHQVSVTMDGDMPFQTNEVAALSFSGKLQKDTSIASGSQVMSLEYYV